MADYHKHEKETDQQYIQLYSPQYTACCGPHIIRMQENPNCGQIFIRAGGDYVCYTEKDHYTVVGAGNAQDANEAIAAGATDSFCDGGCLGPRNKFTMVSKHTLHKSCKFYYNIAEAHLFLADQVIYLLAGKDYDTETRGRSPRSEDKCGPGAFPVLVLQGNRIVASDRVFASASNTASCCSLFHLLPFTMPCSPLEGCS
jgi:hypothetical protein